MASEPRDDESIPPEEILYRRVPPIHVDENGTLTSAAFQNAVGRNAMSVFLDSVLREQGRKPEELLDGHAGYRLVALSASLCRSLGQGVVRAPEDGDDAHAHVIGPKKKKAVKRGFRDGCRLIAEAPSEPV